MPSYLNCVPDVLSTKFFVDKNLKVGVMLFPSGREDLCCFCQGSGQGRKPQCWAHSPRLPSFPKS